MHIAIENFTVKKSHAKCYFSSQSTDMNEDSAVHVLETADPARQMPLESEADVDPMEGEQTWPTEQEIKDAEG